MGRAGFTLVEVLIALLIFALIAAAGTAVLSVSIDNRFAVKANADKVAAFQRTRALLRADIGQAVARRTRGPTGQPAITAMAGPVSGGDALLTLTRAGWTNPGHRARASLQRVEYRLIQGRLERRVSERLDGARLGPPQILFEGVSDATVAFIQDGVEAPTVYANSDRPLPQAVRITMTLQGYGPVTQLFRVGGAA